MPHTSRLAQFIIDCQTRDLDAAAALGAKRVAQVRTWWIMDAPTGHRFCVLRPQLPDLSEHGNRW